MAPASPAGPRRCRLNGTTVAGDWIRWRVAQAGGLAGDLARLYFGLIYWNVRKTLFVFRGRGRNPCQNDGDGHAPGTIRCDACVQWSKAGRFHRVCPLLIRRDNEWRCAAGRDAVRPFWGRAFAWYGAAAAGLHLSLTLLVLVLLRSTNAPGIAWVDVAWPGRWEQIPKQRARAFVQQSMEAFVRGRPEEALVALSSARGLDTRDYDTRLLQAQFAMYQFNVLHADEEFAILLRDYPAQRDRTAVAYHDTLLAMFRAEPLARHCLAMTALDPARTALWVRSLLQALQLAPIAGKFVAEQESAVAALPAHARLLVTAEVAWQSNDRARALAILARPHDGPLNPFYMEEQVARLARLGEHDAASILLYRYGPALGEFEALLARLDLDYVSGDAESVRIDSRTLLALATRPVQIERIIALLVTHADPALYRLLHADLGRRPELAANVSGAAMWVAGLACGVFDEAQTWKVAGRQQFGDGYPAIFSVDFSTRQIDVPGGVPSLVNTLTLPRDVIFALQRRMLPAKEVRRPSNAPAIEAAGP